MNEPLEVREFDTIICNKEYEDSPYFRYLDEKHFKELEQFIREYVSEDDESDIREFLKIGNRKNVGDTISICNYVGIIELPSGFQIEILPKVTFDGRENGYEKTKQIFLTMLKSLKEFEGKSFSSAALNADRMNLYEIFIKMFLQEVQTLVKHGLKSSYITKEENIGFYKGKLLIFEHIKSNITHKERFYMQYDEYHVSRPENRLIKSTLLKLQKISTSSANIREIRQVLGYFEMIEPSVNYQKDFSKVVTDRNTKDYSLLIQWAKIFLTNKSFTTFSGDKSGKALLFPMEKVFESFIAKWVTIIFEDQQNIDISVSAQDSGYYLFDQPKKFKLRPDLVVTSRQAGVKRTIIMDTKWKRLKNDESANYGISQADMYQMYAYAKKYHTSDIWLIYPLNEDVKDLNDISFCASYGEDQDVNVRIFIVDLAEYEESLNSLFCRVFA